MEEWKGKIEVVTRVPVENKDDLSLALHQVLHSLVSKSRRMWINLMILPEDLEHVSLVVTDSSSCSWTWKRIRWGRNAGNGRKMYFSRRLAM